MNKTQTMIIVLVLSLAIVGSGTYFLWSNVSSPPTAGAGGLSEDFCPSDEFGFALGPVFGGLVSNIDSGCGCYPGPGTQIITVGPPRPACNIMIADSAITGSTEEYDEQPVRVGEWTLGSVNVFPTQCVDLVIRCGLGGCEPDCEPRGSYPLVEMIGSSDIPFDEGSSEDGGDSGGNGGSNGGS